MRILSELFYLILVVILGLEKSLVNRLWLDFNRQNELKLNVKLMKDAFIYAPLRRFCIKPPA